jgi:hypothetical protein
MKEVEAEQPNHVAMVEVALLEGHPKPGKERPVCADCLIQLFAFGANHKLQQAHNLFDFCRGTHFAFALESTILVVFLRLNFDPDPNLSYSHTNSAQEEHK